MDEFWEKALDNVEAGKWNADKAIKAVEAGQAGRSRRKASWLKVRVVEDGEKKASFRLPLGLISLIGAAVNPLLKIALRYAVKKKDMKLPIEKLNLRQLLKTLREYGPMTVVDVKDGDTEVLIETS
jgi:hypothetical protein